MEKMKKISIVWGMVIVTLFVLLTIFGIMYKQKSNGYKDLEKKLVEAEKKYADAHFVYPDAGEIEKTEADTLIKEGFLDHLKINDKECIGYATVTHESMVYEYKGYVKCDNYTTKGYK